MCNISAEVNHLHEGLRLGMKADREKRVEALGRCAPRRRGGGTGGARGMLCCAWRRRAGGRTLPPRQPG